MKTVLKYQMVYVKNAKMDIFLILIKNAILLALIIVQHAKAQQEVAQNVIQIHIFLYHHVMPARHHVPNVLDQVIIALLAENINFCKKAKVLINA